MKIFNTLTMIFVLFFSFACATPTLTKNHPKVAPVFNKYNSMSRIELAKLFEKKYVVERNMAARSFFDPDRIVFSHCDEEKNGCYFSGHVTFPGPLGDLRFNYKENSYFPFFFEPETYGNCIKISIHDSIVQQGVLVRSDIYWEVKDLIDAFALLTAIYEKYEPEELITLQDSVTAVSVEPFRLAPGRSINMQITKSVSGEGDGSRSGSK